MIFFDEYSSGHPTQIKKDFKDLKAMPYFGFIKCKVVPPKGLYHPVLPRKRDGKLVLIWSLKLVHGVLLKFTKL